MSLSQFKKKRRDSLAISIFELRQSSNQCWYFVYMPKKPKGVDFVSFVQPMILKVFLVILILFSYQNVWAKISSNQCWYLGCVPEKQKALILFHQTTAKHTCSFRLYKTFEIYANSMHFLEEIVLPTDLLHIKVIYPKYYKHLKQILHFCCFRAAWFVKFIYSEKATTFSERFRKILRPSQNIWTLGQ